MMSSSEDMNIEHQVGDEDNKAQGVEFSQDFEDVDLNINSNSSSID